MKNKLFGLVLAVVMGIICAFGFSACNGSAPDKDGGDKTDSGDKTDNGDNSQVTGTDYITLDKTDIILEVGETVTVTATVSDEFEGTVVWESLDASVATVVDGKITAIKGGSTTIMVIAGVESAWCRVKVNSPIALKDFRCDADNYLDRLVTVEGTVVARFNNTAYIEDYDEETGCYFGMEVYYGFETEMLEILNVGNRVRVVGGFTIFQDKYQISGVKYDAHRPNSPENTIVLSEGHKASFVETSAKDIVSGKIEVDYCGETLTLDYGDAVTATTVTVSNLKVLRSTVKDDKMKLECEAEDGTIIFVNTEILTDKNGTVITADAYEGKTITVKGIVERYFDYDAFNETKIPAYGIRCHLADYITVL